MLRLRFHVVLLFLLLVGHYKLSAFADNDSDSAQTESVTPANEKKYGEYLSKLENKLYSKEFSSDSIQTRLERIERLIYGSAKTGSLDTRMTELLTDVHMLPAAKPSPESMAPATSRSQGTSSYDQRSNQYPAQTNQYPPQSENANPYPQSSTQQYPPQSESANPYPQSSTQQYPPQGENANPYPQSSNPYPPQSENASPYPQSPTQQYPPQGENANPYQRGTQPYAGQAAIRGPQGASSLKSEVTAMEQQVYGQTYPSDTLTNRVARLEKSVFANQATKHFDSLPARVKNLMAALQPQFSQPQNIYSGSPVLSSSKDANTTDEEKQKHGHPFLKKLGHVLERTALEAGSMAGNMTIGGMGGGYGGYGYGGYGGSSGFAW